ncbi:class B sortase [Lachnobacterium bovis]|uniref:Signal peptidase I n=1 Tax=Lachnobacterium bovis TaxID=140626 RepID=A0A1H9TW50_9FIRM|nr:class B sortase [Lachnobacterium bovis]SES01228.1 sortase B [Lachnobacterium bovis]
MENLKKRSNLLRKIGNIIFTLVVILCIPFSIPRIMGYEIYAVKTGSMQPKYPQNCVIYVEEANVIDVDENDVITFKLGTDTNDVMTHRVVKIDQAKKAFITKGDANSGVDKEPVVFSRFIGKPVFMIPFLGVLRPLFSTIIGFVALAFLIVLVVALWISSDILYKRYKKEKMQQDEIEKKDTAGQTDKKKHKKFSLSVVVPLVLGIVLAIYAGGKLFLIYHDYGKSNQLYANLANQYAKKKRKVKKDEWYNKIDIDFKDLKKQNSDVVGWIYFENDDISYPILYSGDNKKYLRTALDKSDAIAGSIFLEEKNKTDFQDSHSLIYGHNMRNLSMFGKLKFYKREPNYYEGHKYFQIITEKKKYRYEIFAYEDVSERSFIYQVPFDKTDEFQQFIDKIRNKSYLKSDIEVTKDDKVVTLSTCSVEKQRFAVHAKRVDEK